MLDTPRSVRLHIAIFGKRNAGKSSLINAITNQELAVVSPIAGTTTDPVFKSMEITPIGPVTLIDTAGIDDEGELGELRVKKTKQVLAKTDLLVLTIAADDMPNAWDTMILEEAEKRCIPVIGVVSKVDIAEGQEVENWFESRKLPFARVNSNTREGIDKLKDLITSNSPKDFLPETIVGDLLKQNDIVILVTPVDAGAPKSRLILPQVQVLRDALDARACVMVVTEHELKTALNALKQPPRLVITDSQAFDFVSKVVPSDVPLTSFSILFARYKGDLREFLNGIKAIDTLAAGDKVLIAEACTHFPSHEDIGRVKIPKWLETKVGGKLDFSWVVGSDFPENLADFKLVVHCGACMINRAEVLARLDKCKALDIPVVNYGIMIGYVTGVLNRVVKPLEK
ncbi:MAG: [FeFe] hydrogenase H-cluster maturation GTPase HydF [Clostridiales bacterium GWB2_37_7]|nr:MAG: [FeFe] hydrogenase H-cluster maturation GTPase HydF [Clostridiales bacterium GWB2_37_7]